MSSVLSLSFYSSVYHNTKSGLLGKNSKPQVLKDRKRMSQFNYTSAILQIFLYIWTGVQLIPRLTEEVSYFIPNFQRATKQSIFGLQKLIPHIEFPFNNTNGNDRIVTIKWNIKVRSTSPINLKTLVNKISSEPWNLRVDHMIRIIDVKHLNVMWWTFLSP